MPSLAANTIISLTDTSMDSGDHYGKLFIIYLARRIAKIVLMEAVVY